jgi:hypothetical protein
MQPIDLYANAHLMVAAIRVIEHQKSVPPSIEDVCMMLSISIELGNFLCRKLFEMGIIDLVEGAFGTKLFIKNHLAIEEIPKHVKASGLEKELRKFQDAKKEHMKKIESIQAEQEEKKKNLFTELEDKLRKSLDKK